MRAVHNPSLPSHLPAAASRCSTSDLCVPPVHPGCTHCRKAGTRCTGVRVPVCLRGNIRTASDALWWLREKKMAELDLAHKSGKNCSVAGFHFLRTESFFLSF